VTEVLNFSLPRFQGPLDLLLSLVRKSQVSIIDIPIAEITRQYLEYMHRAAELDLDLGGEFTYIAATLILIKARSLLRQDPTLAASEADPRQQLIQQLVDYQKVRQNAAEFLEQKLEENRATWSYPPEEEYQDPTSETEEPLRLSSMNVLDVLRLAKEAVAVAKAHRILNLDRETVTVEEMLRWLEVRVAMLPESKTLYADALFTEENAVTRRIALFLAILEMSRVGKLRIEQDRFLGAISLVRSNEYSPVNETGG
jgi:segregation and condensation protein A